MKKLSYSIMLMLAVAGITMMNGCKKEDDTTTPENSPTLSVKPDTDQTVDAGSNITFSWDARKHPDGKSLKTMKAEKDGAGIVTATKKGYTSPATLKSADQSQYLDTLVVTVPLTGGPFVYKFTVETEDGKSASKSITVTLKAAVVNVNVWSGVTLGDQDAAEGSYFNTKDGLVYTFADVTSTTSPLVNIICRTVSSNQQLMSPKDRNAIQALDAAKWPTINETHIAEITMTSADFDAITTTEGSKIVAANTTPTTQTANMIANKVYLFHVPTTDKLGVIKVTAIETSGSGKRVKMDVKVQK